jgi:hypothetical protein
VKTVAKICKVKETDIDVPDWDTYRNEKIGTYIDDTLLRGVSTKKKLSADSGTIKDKRAFWEVALRYFRDASFSDLPTEVQDIARRLYTFIESQNS